MWSSYENTFKIIIINLLIKNFEEVELRDAFHKYVSLLPGISHEISLLDYPPFHNPLYTLSQLLNYISKSVNQVFL